MPFDPTKTTVDESSRLPRSVTTYYTESYAYWLKPLLDMLIESPDKEVYLNCKNYGISAVTLRLRISGAWHYLIDYLDKDNRYANLKKQTQACRFSRDVIKIRRKSKVQGSGILAGVEVSEKSLETVNTKWKEEFESFLFDSREGQYLELRDLLLSETDQAWINNTVLNMDDFAVDEIGKRVLRVSHDKKKALLWRASC